MYRNNSGFSLIELIIVVTMVGILVIVTGSQLLAYTYQGANSSAVADLRNAAAAEKAFFADWGVYSSSSLGGYAGMGAVFTSYGHSTGRIWANSINGTAPSDTIPEPGFSPTVSQNVGLVINTSAGGGSYVMVSKNAGGDRCFGMDSDSKNIYWVNGSLGQPLNTMAIPYPVAGTDDLNGVAGMMPCGGLPGGQGQLTWTAL